MEAQIEYAWNGETSLAYQVLEGPEPGLLYLQGYLSNVEPSPASSASSPASTESS